MSEKADEKDIWNGLRRAEKKIEIAALLSAAQEQETQINYIKRKIDKTPQLPFCRICAKESEM